MNKNEIRLVKNDRGYFFNKINFVVAVYSGEQTKKMKCVINLSLIIHECRTYMQVRVSLVLHHDKR